MTMRRTLRKINDWSKLDAQLITLWADHSITTREIGDKLGVTKNAVIGRAHRLHLPARPNGFPWLPPPPVRTHAPRPKPRPPNTPPTLIDLKPHMCKWPINSPERGGTYLFCGEGTVNGHAYCEVHQAIGFSGKGTARATTKAGWVPRPVEFGR